MSDINVIFCFWDEKEQPNWKAVNEALSEIPNARIYPVDSHSGTVVVMVAEDSLSEEEAQAIYEEESEAWLEEL